MEEVYNQDIAVKKLVRLNCALVLISMIIIGAFICYRTMDTTTSLLLGKSEREIEFITNELNATYELLENDISILAHTPPIQGMIRATNNNGFDSFDNSSLDTWKNRLQNIFFSMIKSREFYTQIRFLDAKGKETVRVNRKNDEVELVKKSDLQNKDNELYYQQGILLKEEEILFSELSYNREYGKTSPLLIPTIRAISPVYDNNNLFGLLIININYIEFLKEIFDEAHPKDDVFIITDNGDYIEYGTNDKKINLVLYENNYNPSSIIDAVLRKGFSRLSFTEEGKTNVIIKSPLKINANNKFISIGISSSANELNDILFNTRIYAFTIMTLILILCVIITKFTSRRIINDLVAKDQEIT